MPPRLPAHGAVQRSVTLAEALGVGAGEVVAFIGAGGKTIAMYRLAADLAARGLQVIVTTTTKILPPDRPDVQLVLQGTAGLGTLASRAAAALVRAGVVAVATRLLPDGKLEGVAPEAILALRAISGVAAVLVEADGAARKPFKAPAEHEPVIPPATTLLVAVVGADVLGEPLTGDLVHRPGLAAQQGGVEVGDVLTPEVVARILLGPANLRGKPAGARLAALITRARAPVERDTVHRLAYLLVAGGASPVLIAELVADPVSISVVV